MAVCGVAAVVMVGEHLVQGLVVVLKLCRATFYTGLGLELGNNTPHFRQYLVARAAQLGNNKSNQISSLSFRFIVVKPVHSDNI